MVAEPAKAAGLNLGEHGIPPPPKAAAPVGTPPPGTPRGAGEAGLDRESPGARRRRVEGVAGDDGVSLRQIQNQYVLMSAQMQTLADQMQRLMSQVAGQGPGPTAAASAQGPMFEPSGMPHTQSGASAGSWERVPGMGPLGSGLFGGAFNNPAGPSGGSFVPPPPPGFGFGFQGANQGQGVGDPGVRKVLLEEKYFRRIEQFAGDAQVYRSWLFDLLVSIGWVDGGLADLLTAICKKGYDEKWDPFDCEILRAYPEHMSLYNKYASEMYGLLCSLTTGEAKSIVKEVSDRGFKDGFRALVVLNNRYDSKTAASMLRAFTDVVNPTQIKSMKDVVSGINKWESRIASLKMRYGEDLNENLKTAIFMSMMPKECQDLILAKSCSNKKIGYSEIRDYIMGLSHGKEQLIHPTLMDIGGMNQEAAEGDIDAVSKDKIKCHNCGGFGHYQGSAHQKRRAQGEERRSTPKRERILERERKEKIPKGPQKANRGSRVFVTGVIKKDTRQRIAESGCKT